MTVQQTDVMPELKAIISELVVQVAVLRTQNQLLSQRLAANPVKPGADEQ